MPLFTSNKAIHGSVGINKGRTPTANWKDRQIITTGYTGAGYAASVTWRNVNKIPHATEVSSNLGDILQEAANYTSGACGRDNAFIWGTNGTGTDGNGSFTSTSCFSMRTDTTLTKTLAMNTTYTVGDTGTMQVSDQWGSPYAAWMNGSLGAAYIQRWNIYTESMQSTISTTFSQAGTGAASHFGETFGYWWNDDSSVASPPSTGKMKFVYATETQSTPTANIGWNGQQKGISSKNGFGWTGNEGNYAGGNYLRKTQYSTETVVSTTTVTKPHQNCGEENFDMGQDKQFMLGMYNGAQTNLSWRFTYATDSGIQGGTSMQPSGTQSGTGSTAGAAIPGRSSGHSWWRD